MEEFVLGLATSGAFIETRAVDEEDVEPAIVIVVEEGHARTCSFDDVLLLVVAAGYVDEVKLCFPGNIAHRVAQGIRW